MKITLNILENVDSQNNKYENQEEKQLNYYYNKLKYDIRSISKDEKIYSKLNKYLTAKINDKESYYRENILSVLKAYELNHHGELKNSKI